jgi:hypothetical protein
MKQVIQSSSMGGKSSTKPRGRPTRKTYSEPQLRTDVSATRLGGGLDTNLQVTSKIQKLKVIAQDLDLN